MKEEWKAVAADQVSVSNEALGETKRLITEMRRLFGFEDC